MTVDLEELFLFPRPRHLEGGGEGAPVDTAVREVETAGLPPEGFELNIGPDAIILRYADERARRYGQVALAQVKTQATDRLPALRIRDWPDFAVRGYMLDISRDRVPTRATLERLVEIMSIARINQFQLYTEHTFAYRDHEVVWRDASPITPDDLRWLYERCDEHGVELVANQNCFGHMNRWLRHDAYRHRAEVPDGIEIRPGRTVPPTTLAPTPENAAFVLALLDELLPHFTSRRVNIGCDEPFELGKGVSRAEVERRGEAAVYAEHVARIARPLTEAGHEVLFWDDMVRKEPSWLHALPEGAVALVWWYGAPRRPFQPSDIPAETRSTLRKLGIDVDLLATYGPGFRTVAAPVADAGFPFWVAPGTSTWNSLVGRIDEARANLIDAAEVGLERGAQGYLITDWGDNGHLQPPSVSFGPLVYGGAVSWCLEANRDVHLAGVLDELVFDDGNAILGALLESIGRLWRKTGQVMFNGSPLQAAFDPRQMGMLQGKGDPTKAAAVAEQLDDALSRLARAVPDCADGDIVRQELEAAIRLARHGAWRLAGRASGAELTADLEDAIDRQRQAWLARSRPGGLDDSLRPLEASLARLV